MRSRVPRLVAVFLLVGCSGQQSSALGPLSDPGVDGYVDSHFHISNYAMQGIPLQVLIDEYMGDRVLRSVAMPLPLQQKWDPFEHYAGDRMAPNYYMGPKAELYYYSFIDALLAKEYQSLSSADQARIDPMIVGFNPMDRYAVQHIKRVLLTFPGVFTGIGEFTVHKEIVSDKIAGESIESLSLEPVPGDARGGGKLTLFSPALEAVLDFAGEAGLVVVLHSDVYPARVRHDGGEPRVSPEQPYTAGMKHLCRASPDATVIWAHTGLGRFVEPAPNHLDLVSEILDECPRWSTDISWDLVQRYIVGQSPGGPSLEEWTAFVTTYQDRVLWGSDTVIHGSNKLDGETGRISEGRAAKAESYLQVLDITKPLWDAVGPSVARKVKLQNHLRIFDASRDSVRAWERANAHEYAWNLPRN